MVSQDKQVVKVQNSSLKLNKVNWCFADECGHNRPFFIKKTLLTFIIILFMLEMAIVSDKRDVIHLLATGNVFFFFYLHYSISFPPSCGLKLRCLACLAS